MRNGRWCRIVAKKIGTKTPSEPKLSEVARHVIQPEGVVRTDWPDVRRTCANLGWRFDRWQDGAGRLIMAKRKDGQYAADTVVMSIGRQVGKTYLAACIIYALCLRQPGLTVIWTAHHKETAIETFSTFSAMAQRPAVAAHVRQVLSGRGGERVLFKNRSRILFGAREVGFGRGFSAVDVLVFDEAQIMDVATLEDMAAAQNVAENPLTFMMGTPPRPRDNGEMFTLMRQEAVTGESEGTLYIELSSDRDADSMDRDQWRKANPSFPKRTSERALLRLHKKLPDDSWRREALGIWDDFSRFVPVVAPRVWRHLVDPGPEDGARPDALAMDASHARDFSVVACWRGAEGAHAEEVWAGRDDDELFDWLLDRTTRRMPIVVDHYSPAASLVPRLKQAGRTVKVTSAADMAKACGLWLSDVEVGRLTHVDQESVNRALDGGRKRAIGNAGGWGWDRRDETINIAPLVAHTLARLGADLGPKPVSSVKSAGRVATVT